MGLRTGRAAGRANGLAVGLLTPTLGRRTGRAIGDAAEVRGRRLGIGLAGPPTAGLAGVPAGRRRRRRLCGSPAGPCCGMITPPLM